MNSFKKAQRQRRKTTEEDCQTIIRLSSDHTVWEIMKILKMNAVCVYKVLDDNGIVAFKKLGSDTVRVVKPVQQTEVVFKVEKMSRYGGWLI